MILSLHNFKKLKESPIFNHRCRKLPPAPQKNSPTLTPSNRVEDLVNG
jgi:hypothetical protein